MDMYKLLAAAWLAGLTFLLVHTAMDGNPLSQIILTMAGVVIALLLTAVAVTELFS